MLRGVIEELPAHRSPRIVVAGVAFFGNPFIKTNEWSDETQIDSLWDRYERTVAVLPELPEILAEPEVRYEIRVESGDTAKTGFLEIFAGQQVREGAEVPFQLCTKYLPAASYAAFAISGEDAAGDWYGWITREWFPHSPYVADGTHVVQLRRATDSTEVWIPVRRRA